jgi:hypothetical protein
MSDFWEHQHVMDGLRANLSKMERRAFNLGLRRAAEIARAWGEGQLGSVGPAVTAKEEIAAAIEAEASKT